MTSMQRGSSSTSEGILCQRLQHLWYADARRWPYLMYIPLYLKSESLQGICKEDATDLDISILLAICGGNWVHRFRHCVPLSACLQIDARLMQWESEREPSENQQLTQISSTAVRWNPSVRFVEWWIWQGIRNHERKVPQFQFSARMQAFPVSPACMARCSVCSAWRLVKTIF